MNPLIKVDAKEELLGLIFNNVTSKDRALVSKSIRADLECLECNSACSLHYKYNVREYEYHIFIHRNIVVVYNICGEECSQDVYTFQPNEFQGICYMAKLMREKYGEV